MKRLKAVFWDLDGTIADTEMNGHRIAFNKAFLEAGLPFRWNKDTYKKLLRIPGGNNRMRYFFESQKIKLNNKEISSLHSTKQNYYKEIIAEGNVEIRIGVKRLIEELSKNKVIQYIVTTSTRIAVESILLNKLHSESFAFTRIITAEDVQNLKPKPDAYIKAVRLSNCSHNDILVIEDSFAGLKAAKSANLSCIITLPPWDQNSFQEFTEADAIVNHLGDSLNTTLILDGPYTPKKFLDFNYLNLLIKNKKL